MPWLVEDVNGRAGGGGGCRTSGLGCTMFSCGAGADAGQPTAPNGPIRCLDAPGLKFGHLLGDLSLPMCFEAVASRLSRWCVGWPVGWLMMQATVVCQSTGPYTSMQLLVCIRGCRSRQKMGATMEHLLLAMLAMLLVGFVAMGTRTPLMQSILKSRRGNAGSSNRLFAGQVGQVQARGPVFDKLCCWLCCVGQDSSKVRSPVRSKCACVPAPCRVFVPATHHQGDRLR
jgi:hypothetical protein